MTTNWYLRSYNALSGAARTLVFFEYENLIYINNRKHISSKWLSKSYESSKNGGGEKFRLYIKKEERARLVKSSIPVMTVEEFNNLPYANKGHKCEYWLHMVCNLGEYKPDHIRFDKCGDVCINGIEYQVKFQNASMTSIDTLHKAQKDARARRKAEGK